MSNIRRCIRLASGYCTAVCLYI